MSVNKVTLLGNVCNDPRITTFQEGGKVAQFRLATNKPAYKTKEGREIPEQSDFHNIVVNRTGLAEVVEKFVKKGHKLYLEGELRTREYNDSENIKRLITEIYVNEMEMLSPKASNQAPAPQPGNPEPF